MEFLDSVNANVVAMLIFAVLVLVLLGGASFLLFSSSTTDTRVEADEQKEKPNNLWNQT